ncbi:NDH dependent flow 6 [Prunus dulcis]|uniref:NDH dependent flow 6 n=1 Tax=Prunus dulcis TaxID=3755 RepID=A0A4Y1RJB0_PRUDU|nr:NDH dependent flow 6 [Prunus dulcis]
MAEAIMGFTIISPHIHSSSLQTAKLDMTHTSSCTRLLRQSSSSELFSGAKQLVVGKNSKRASLCKTNAFPDWPLMAVLVEQIEGQRDLITHKSIVHLSDESIKNDPYYDSETYRKDGGDGTGHWIYEKQADIEESARAELWREELIEEIEQKVGSLRELEEAVSSATN